jgi:hypothetical protein
MSTIPIDRVLNTPIVLTSASGKTYRVAEIPLAGLGRLQEWIRRDVPHPLASIRDHLDGFAPADRTAAIEAAVKAAADWPPRVGTVEAGMRLWSSQEGGRLVIREVLLAAGSEASEAEVEALYREMQVDPALSRRVLAISIGRPDPTTVEQEGDEKKAV